MKRLIQRSAPVRCVRFFSILCLSVFLVIAHADAQQTDRRPAARRKRAQTAMSAFRGGKNILPNGGFEQGAAGWRLAKGHEIAKGGDVARSGNACVTGEVTGSKEALFLTRKVPVNKGYLYRYEIWARGTRGAKMTVFHLQPGRTPKQRRSIGTFTNVARQWRRCEGTFTAEATGDLELQIVAPSSHGAPPSRMWVDDVAVYEFAIAPAFPVSNGVGFNDQPSMARAEDGSLYVAWVSFRDGDDSLQLARFRPEGDGFERLGEWPILQGKRTFAFAPRVVAAGEKAWLLYSAEVKGNWDIYAVECGPNGPGRPIRLTKHAGVDTKPAGAWQDGKLRIAWESNRNGNRQIFATVLEDGKRVRSRPEPRAISAGEISSYDPSIAVTPDGRAWVAWHSFADNNFDVYAGSLDNAKRLTRAPTIDRHAVLFTRGPEVWVAYENSQMKEYGIGSVQDKRLVVARIEPGGVEVPSSGDARSPLMQGGEAAAPVFDESGRLWLAFLRGYGKAWNLLLTGHEGGGWSDASPVSSFKGMDRRPSIAIDGRRAILAYQSDDMPGSFPNKEASLKSKSDIYLTRFDFSKAGAALAMEMEPFVERDEAFEAGELRVAYGEDSATPSIEYKGQTLNLYYGNLHDHTEVSVCNRLRDESINEAYQDMRDITGCDFACVTDHGYNMTPYLWDFTAKMARQNNDPGRFLTFLAEEWTSTFEEYSDKHPYGFYGHRNLIFGDPYFPRWWNARNYQTPAEVWEDLRKMKANYVHIPHQLADTGNVPVDWDFADETAQPVAEIFQARGSYEYKGTPREAQRTTPEKGPFLQDAWARGVVIGVIASPDHGGGEGKACVYAPELTRKSILDAIRARHCYGTTAAKIGLDVRVNGTLMGEKIPAPRGKPVEIAIRVRCPGEIDRIEVCRSNKFIYAKRIDGREAEFTYIDETPLDGFSYYYVRVMQEDEEIAWSSPVWLGAK